MTVKFSDKDVFNQSVYREGVVGGRQRVSERNVFAFHSNVDSFENLFGGGFEYRVK